MNGPTRTLTQYQMELLSDIFRLIIREIKTDEDKEKLAPGELGISYTNGCFYVKNPYTGELFSPNSLDHITQILSKYDEGTNILNADKVSGLRVYTSTTQIPQLPINMSADTIIRQMEYPSILFSNIYQETPEGFRYPGNNGFLQVIKIDPESVSVSFRDYQTYVTYDGIYNPDTHELTGWVPSGAMAGSYYCVTRNGGMNPLIIDESITVSDMTVLVVRVTEEINPGAHLTMNDIGPFPIISFNGDALDVPVAANNIIMLIYDKVRTSWILTNVTASSMMSIIHIMNDRLTAMRSEFDTFKSDTAQKFSEVYDYINTELKKPATIETVRFDYIVNSARDDVPALQDYVVGLDKLVVLYGQTMLYEGEDYQLESDNSIMFNFTLNTGDTVHFIIIKQTYRA